MMPRTSIEGGLVEVKLKRKAEYKNYHRQEYVDPSKLFKAINFLKASGNRFYQDVCDIDEYKKGVKLEILWVMILYLVVMRSMAR